MIKDKTDLEWHKTILLYSLRARDSSVVDSSLWDLFDKQAARIKAEIEEHSKKAPSKQKKTAKQKSRGSSKGRRKAKKS